MAKLDPKDFMFSKQKDEILVKKPGEINGIQFILEELEDCTVYLMDVVGDMQVDYLKNCRVMIGPVDGSIFIRNCEGCNFTIACRQLRTRDCHNCDFNVFVATDPVIESSHHMRFATWNGAYPQAASHFAKLNFDVNDNHWQKVYDFTAGDTTIPQPHWEFIPDADFAVWPNPKPGLGVNENPVPLPDGTLWVAPTKSAPRGKAIPGDASPVAKPLTPVTLKRQEFQAAQQAHDEEAARLWLSRILNATVEGSLADLLHNGTILCHCLNIVSPDAVVHINRPASGTMSQFKMIENITRFNEGARKLGLPTEVLFEPIDLVEQKNLKKVFASICQLAELGKSTGRVQMQFSSVKLSSPDDVAATADTVQGPSARVLEAAALAQTTVGTLAGEKEHQIQEHQSKVEQAARMKAEHQKQRAEAEAKQKAAADALAKAEQEAKEKAEAAAKRKAETEAKLRAKKEQIEKAAADKAAADKAAAEQAAAADKAAADKAAAEQASAELDQAAALEEARAAAQSAAAEAARQEEEEATAVEAARRQAEQMRRAAEEQAAVEKAAEQRAAEQRAAEEQAAADKAAAAAAEKAAVEQQAAAEQRAAKQRAAAEEQAAAEKAAAEKAAAEKAAAEKAAEEQAAAEERAAAEQAAADKAAAEQQAAEEQRIAEERAAEEQAAAEEAARRSAAEKAADEQRAAEEKAARLQAQREAEAAIEQAAAARREREKAEKAQADAQAKAEREAREKRDSAEREERARQALLRASQAGQEGQKQQRVEAFAASQQLRAQCAAEEETQCRAAESRASAAVASAERAVAEAQAAVEAATAQLETVRAQTDAAYAKTIADEQTQSTADAAAEYHGGSRVSAWEARHEDVLSAKSDRARQQQRANHALGLASNELFHAQRRLVKAQNAAARRAEQTAFVRERDSGPHGANTWERVASFIDFKAPVQGRDVARLRGLLLMLKQHPPAHMQ